MIVLAFFVILTLSVIITNKKNEAQPSDEMLEFSPQDSLIILICMASSFILNYLAKTFFLSFYWVITLIASGVFVMILMIVNVNRENIIKRKHDQIIKTFQALTDILGNVNVENIDFTNIPFTLEEDQKTGNVCKITLDTSIPGIKANDNSITLAQYSINKFFPDSQWTSEVDYPNRNLTVIGLPKPPDIAKWKGSDYRPTGWIPLGLSGQGEVGWNIANPKSRDMGVSMYIDDDGHSPEYVDMPSAPQCLTLGSPLSLNTFIPTTDGYKTMETIQVGDYVFDLSNKPVKVLGLSPIQESKEMFKMTLKNLNGKDVITVKSDEIHKFPIIYKNGNKDLKPMKWLYSNKDSESSYFTIIGLDSNGVETNYEVLNIERVKNELVRCILVDSSSHLFMITDKIESNWTGGNKYSFKSILTSNTGGGKAVFIEQYIEVIKHE